MKIFNKKYNLFQLRWIIAIIISVVLLSSCKKNLLNTVPQTSISSATAYSTPAKIQAAVYGLYSGLQNGSFYGGRYIIFNEQRGDEFSQNDPNSATGAAVWGQNISASTDLVNNLWDQAYVTINSANLLIDNISNTAVISDSLSSEYTGEAKFIRALSYFSLVQTFGKPYLQDSGYLALPLRLTGINSSGNNNFAFSSVAAVYQQIIQDLDDAEAVLPASYSTASQNAVRAHKAAAIALKTRVYLAEGNYSKVISEASKLVPAIAPYQYVNGTAIHKLEPNISTVFNGSYTGAEAIFFIAFANSTTETPASQSSLAYTYLGEPILSLNPAGIISNPVFSSTTDARVSLIKSSSGQQLLKKFSITTAPFSDFIPVIRYAEVLLNYAEASANNNDLVTATALLSTVRNRSDPSYVFATSSVNTKDSLINTILTERRIELLGEGFRAPDLFRRVQTLPAKSGAAGSAPAVAPTANNYIWPTPSSETADNTLAP
jgi:hypothetical protein